MAGDSVNGVNGISSAQFSQAMIGAAGTSADAQIKNLQDLVDGGKLSDSQKTQALAEIDELKQKQAKEKQQKANPLANVSIFDAAKKNQQHTV